MFNITTHHGNANQKYFERLSDLSQNNYPEEIIQQMLVRMLGEKNTYSLLVGMQTSSAIMEIYVEIFQGIKNRTMMWLSYTPQAYF